ncbi:NAD(P)-dependent oxidoreductase [Ferruginibacter sp. HRS2-29]|uniref:NAD-dependent epimerase/dehydratase family protein n=1 Tax=Ferruginibacter sp. HRS2-29 TaxID=2487334 RepID=UPI0020CCED95|nr:NAD(P)-dependent oxidoreductase [Ferruginibacter sp. HRS2-29]MCP9753141.1 NAD(P)-dependent oxidoreductase [Ferruginibacter sp. HRS2-29]
MKILITGSSGHLGEALMRTLKDSEHECIGIDIKPSEFTKFVGSIADPVFVRRCMAGVDAVLHTATLHKPHVGTHSDQDFIDTNITGTLNLLEESLKHHVQAFICTSTTSTFGDMLTPEAGTPAIWITEDIQPIPKNIYGVTKTAAEDLCQLFFRNHGLPCLVLKTSRFFPEEDDKKATRESYDDLNIKANEYLYRRMDIEDVVTAHLAALDKAKQIGFGKYIISATTPFNKEQLNRLRTDAPEVVASIFPEYEQLFKEKNWRMLPEIDRVYVNEKARRELNWQPKYDFAHVLDCLRQNKDFRSPLTLAVGKKGYHDEVFEQGPYPVKEHG